MGLVTKIGLWLDKRFPEKVTAEEVYRKLADLESAKFIAENALKLVQQVTSDLTTLEATTKKLADEIKSVRDFAGLKSRLVSSAPNGPAKTPPGIAR